LPPAFDLTYSYNPSGAWTGTHQMSMNGKRDGFDHDDFISCARLISLQRGRADEILEQVKLAVLQWPKFANEAEIDKEPISKIKAVHRTDILN